MDSAKQLRDLSKVYMEAVYGGAKKEEKKDTRLTVTNADKKANTPAWQKYKAGSTAYKAADHVKEGKDESPEAEEEKDKEDDDLAGSPNKKGKKKAKRWWDDDGDGKGYEDGEVDGKFKKKKKDDVKESTVETYGTKGKLKKELKDLGKGANTLKGKNIEKADEVAEQKDTPDQVAAVIDMYRSKKGTDEATKDSEEGKKKAAKKERDYAKWERDKMARDAQKSGHPWEHAKGSTTEKEGKKSIKHAHVKDSYNWQNESKEAEEYLDTVSQVKKSEEEADIKRWSALEESGKFTAEEIESLKEADRLEKFEAWNEFDEGYQRDPERGEREDTRSARQKRMDSPDKGINSPAFRKFMADKDKGSSAKKSAPAKSKPNPEGTLHLSPEERKKREEKRRLDLYKRSADMRRDQKKRGVGPYAKGAKNPGADMDKKLGI